MVRQHALPQTQHQLLWPAVQMSEDGRSPGFLVAEPAELASQHVVGAEVEMLRWIGTDGKRNHSSQVHLKY